MTTRPAHHHKKKSCAAELANERHTSKNWKERDCTILTALQNRIPNDGSPSTNGVDLETRDARGETIDRRKEEGRNWMLSVWMLLPDEPAPCRQAVDPPRQMSKCLAADARQVVGVNCCKSNEIDAAYSLLYCTRIVLQNRLNLLTKGCCYIYFALEVTVYE